MTEHESYQQRSVCARTHCHKHRVVVGWNSRADTNRSSGVFSIVPHNLNAAADGEMDREEDGKLSQPGTRAGEDERGAVAPLRVYCDMQTAGGGWTLVARVCGSDRDTKWGYNAPSFVSPAAFGACTSLDNTNCKSAAYSQVCAGDFCRRRPVPVVMHSHQPSGTRCCTQMSDGCSMSDG